MSGFKSRLTAVLGYTHLVYLGLLPALATFSLLFLYGHPLPLLLLLGGTVAVGVYLAVIVTYTPPAKSVGWALLTLLDGPAWVVLSFISRGGSPFAFAVEGFLVDGTSIWLSILVLAMRSPIPTKQQRLQSIGFMLAALAATVSLVWPYYRDRLLGHWVGAGILGLGTVQALYFRYKVLKQDDVERNSDKGVVYIVVLILVWVGSMILGMVLHEIRNK